MNQSFSKEQFSDLLHRFIEGKCTKEEQDQVTRWYQTLGEDIRLYVDEETRSKLKQVVWARIAGKLNIPKDNSLNSRNKIKYVKLAGIAAAITLIGSFIGYSIVWFTSKESNIIQLTQTSSVKGLQEVLNTSKQAIRFSLRDGSMIVLQPAGKVRFNDVKNEKSRMVYLEGEAYFEVAHDRSRPFSVHTGAIVTKVLGTSFSVKAGAKNDDVTISVKTGRVSVSKTEVSTDTAVTTVITSVILTQNQKAIFNPVLNKLTTSLVERPVPLPESSGNMSMQFDEESVGVILNEFEKIYGVDIIYDEELIQQCRITAAFSKEGLFERLNVVAKTIGASYYEDGTKIIFTSSGCN